MWKDQKLWEGLLMLPEEQKFQCTYGFFISLGLLNEMWFQMRLFLQQIFYTLTNHWHQNVFMWSEISLKTGKKITSNEDFLNLFLLLQGKTIFEFGFLLNCSICTVSQSTAEYEWCLISPNSSFMQLSLISWIQHTYVCPSHPFLLSFQRKQSSYQSVLLVIVSNKAMSYSKCCLSWA